MQFNSVLNAGQNMTNLSRMELPSPTKAPKADTSHGMEKSFKNALKEMVGNANSGQLDAKESIRELASGDNVSIHGTMIALEKADISLRLATQVRNKAVEAYKEVMQMQV